MPPCLTFGVAQTGLFLPPPLPDDSPALDFLTLHGRQILTMDHPKPGAGGKLLSDVGDSVRGQEGQRWGIVRQQGGKNNTICATLR